MQRYHIGVLLICLITVILEMLFLRIWSCQEQHGGGGGELVTPLSFIRGRFPWDPNCCVTLWKLLTSQLTCCLKWWQGTYLRADTKVKQRLHSTVENKVYR